jgi:diguanylate cyclase (GGDEF)-like protein
VPKSGQENVFCELQECPVLDEVLVQGMISPDRQIRKLDALLLKDPLTGLPNRTKLIRDIPLNDCPVLFLVNIDRFSQINSMFGHQTGDEVLKAVAKRLRQRIDQRFYRLYKLPADEFALLINIGHPHNDCTQLAVAKIPWRQLRQIAAELTTAVEKEHLALDHALDGDLCNLGVNITTGIAVAHVVGRANLLTHAEIALKTAKQKRKPFLFFKESTVNKDIFLRNMQRAGRLKKALDNDDVVPYFQPLLNLHSGCVEKYEALVRLKDAHGRIVAPSEFLQLAKIVRLYPALMKSVFEKTVAHSARQRQAVSINLSIEDILNSDLTNDMRRQIEKRAIGPLLTFEILESEAITIYEHVVDFIKCFQAIGCQIAIDDFGVGYSNFLHIVKLKIDYLKVDATLIRHLDTDYQSQAIVKSIVSFAHKLGIQTVAEGVATDSLLNTVRTMGIDFAQGHYVGRPKAEMPKRLSAPHRTILAS